MVHCPPRAGAGCRACRWAWVGSTERSYDRATAFDLPRRIADRINVAVANLFVGIERLGLRCGREYDEYGKEKAVDGGDQ